MGTKVWGGPPVLCTVVGILLAAFYGLDAVGWLCVPQGEPVVAGIPQVACCESGAVGWPCAAWRESAVADVPWADVIYPAGRVVGGER